MRKAILIPFVLGLSLAVGGVLWVGAAEPAPQAPAADPQLGGWNMELVSQWWGTFTAVEISGTYAYLTQGQRLSIFDISDPGNIDLVAQSEVLTNHSENLRVSGDYAFLADPGIYAYGQEAGSRLHVIDISDPAAPYEVVYLENDDNRAWDIELYGGYAFLADGDDLWVVDVSDPLHPLSVKRMHLTGEYARHIRIAYHATSDKVYAYLLASSDPDRLVVVDITDPSNPVRRVSLDINYDLVALALSGDHAYILDDFGGLYVIDISNPLSPSQVTAYDIVDYYDDLEVSGDSLYAGGSGLLILNVSNPAAPSVIGSHPFPAYILDVELIPNQGKVFMISDDDLAAVDVTDPGSPSDLGSFHQEGGIIDIERSGDIVYLSRGENWLRPKAVEAYDFHDPHNPVKLGSLPVKAHVDSLGGNYLYLLQPRDMNPDPSIPGGLVIVDVSDPANMSVTDIFTTTYMYENYNDVAVHAEVAYLADGPNGLYLLDVSDPYNIEQINRYNPTDEIYTVSIGVPAHQPDRIYAYLGTNPSGLRILDVTDPHAITERGTYQWVDGANSILYTPNLITGTLPAAGYYLAIISDGDIIELFDVSDPDAPIQVYGIVVQGAIYNLAVQGEYLYAAAGLRGVRAVKYEGGEEFNTFGYYRLPEEVFDVAVSGDFLHLATLTNGLFNVWFGPSSFIDIDLAGGTLTSSFHNTSLIFPADTFTTTARITYAPRYFGNLPPHPGFAGIGVDFRLSVSDWETRLKKLSPQLPYQFELHYDESDLHGLDETGLGLYHWDGSQWVKQPGSVDPEANTLTATTQQTELFEVLLDERKSIYVPMITR